MKIVLLASAVVLAVGQNPPPTAVEDSRTSPREDNSLLLSLLQTAGFSHFCISEALQQCSEHEKEGSLTSLMEDLKEMVLGKVIPQLKTLISLHITATQDNSPPRHCQDLLDSGDSESGLRDVFPDPDRPHYRVEVYCEQEIDGGGWTIFQRRSNGNTRQSFERTWFEYEEGFGEKTGEFWLGLKNIHLLTTMTQQEVRIDLEDYEGGHRWAKYGVFHVDPQNTNYRLTIDRYSGDAGDAMGSNNEAEFSTPDADHDTHDPDNCAARWRGGWWNKACGDANLNGYQLEGQYSASYPEGIWWHQWHGPYYSLKRTTMMVRPAPQPFF